MKKLLLGISLLLVIAEATNLAMAQAQGEAQKPKDQSASQSPTSTSGGSNNPFPGEATDVPVIPVNSVRPPSKDADSATSGTDPSNELSYLPRLLRRDDDPVRSPEDPVASGEESEASVGESSSQNGLDHTWDNDGDKAERHHRKLAILPKPKSQQESAAQDVEVGTYYLERKNWKGAISRFQSAMVLDPENPEVYWGLAEAERHMGQMADARAHYLKLLDFDPDGPHGKAVRKALKDPELVNAKNAELTTAPPKLESPKQ